MDQPQAENRTDVRPEEPSSRPSWRVYFKYRSVQLVLALVCLCIGVYVYFAHSRRADIDRQGEVIAKLTFLRDRVEVRYAGEFTWRKSVPDLPLMNEDAVKTYEDSGAMVEFGPQSFLKVGEDSLVIIRKAPGEGEEFIEVRQGEIEGTSNRPLTVKMADKETRFTPGEAGVGRFEIALQSGGNGELRLLEGKSEIKVGEAKTELKQGEVATLKEGQIAGMTVIKPPNVEGPVDRTTIEINPETGAAPLHLAFEDPNKEYRIEISQDPRFTRTVIADQVKGGSFEAKNLGEGTYYWRVAEVNPDGSRSVYTPANRISLELPRGGESFPPDLRSAPPSMAVIDGGDRIRIVRSGREIAVADAGGILPGDHVGGVGGGETVFRVSENEQIRLMEESQVVVNDLRRDAKGGIGSKLQLEKGSILLRLQRKEGQPRAQQEILVDGRKYLFSTDKIDGSSAEILLTRDEKGSVQARVLSGSVLAKIGNDDVRLEAMKTATITREGQLSAKKAEEPVDLVLHEGMASNVFYSPGLTLIAMEWADRGGKSTFQCARDDSFRKLVSEQQVTGGRAVMAVPGAGVFFWRHISAGQASPPTQIGFFPGHDSRAGAFKSVVRPNIQNVVFGSQPPVLTFEWKGSPGIARYRFEMYRDHDGKQKLFEKEVVRTTSVGFFADFLGEGDYYWRVFSLDYKAHVVDEGKMFHVRLDRNPLAPTVDIAYPEETQTTSDRILVARGMLLSDGELSINGQTLRKGSAGPFTVRLDLQDGTNSLVFKETREGQKVSYYLRKVVLETGKRSAQ
ncbi:MAG TPA: hypothetical protein VI895_06445 [Bdellovibrionota bacterium]|nr:hypothetical protein [Bdellovibrionota bacterium]